VHSLVRLLSNYDVKLNYVSPANLRMPDELKAEIKKLNIEQNEYDTLDPILATTDVLYVTRVQKERFKDLAEYERVKDSFVINNAVMRKCKTQMIVMHPLPRVNEIDPEVDFDQRSAYFRQMRYGLYVRMVSWNQTRKTREHVANLVVSILTGTIGNGLGEKLRTRRSSRHIGILNDLSLCRNRVSRTQKGIYPCRSDRHLYSWILMV